MTVIAVASVRTSPGATTLATGLAFAEATYADQVYFVEADPCGGVQALRFGLDASPNLATFAADARSVFAPELLMQNSQDMRGVRCLAGPANPNEAGAWVAKGARILEANLDQIAHPMIVDIGRVVPSSPSLSFCEVADLTLLVTRTELAEVQALVGAVQIVRDAGGDPRLICVGSEPFDPEEVAAVADVPLLGVVPDDPTLAKVLSGHSFSPKKFQRSLYWRAILDIHNRVMPAPPENEATPVPVDSEERDYMDTAPVDGRAATTELSWSCALTGSFGRVDVPPVGTVVIGRGATCDLKLMDNHVSRVHCEIAVGAAGYQLTDAESKNGLLVNGEPVTHHLLGDGDTIRIGNTELIVELRGDGITYAEEAA